MLAPAHAYTHTHTRGSEEGLRQPVVGGNLFDLCGYIDEPSNHWRDSVKAQQSEKEEDTEPDIEMGAKKIHL